jgi:hypothetical protein
MQLIDNIPVWGPPDERASETLVIFVVGGESGFRGMCNSGDA